MNMNYLRACCLLALGLATSPTRADEVGNVALLLPLHGHMASVGTIIRAGFLAAYYQDIQQGQPSPIVRIYDNGEGQGSALVQNAAQDGADAVVGPLNKDQVASVAGAASLPLPVLALNHADGGGARLYQFALAPEEEMATLVRAMKAQNILRVRVLLAHDAASERNRQLFETSWQAAGGVVVPAFTVDPTQKGGVVSGIRKLMTDPATAQLDALFLATPGLSTQVHPTIAYYHTVQLPLYTLSTAYDASAAAITHQDQDGMRFCDLPWVVLGGWPEQSGLYADGRLPSSYDRLYGFGGDAYTLIKAIYRNPAHVDMAGRSGHLSLGDRGRIQREPSCVELDDGHTQVLAAPGGVATPAAGT